MKFDAKIITNIIMKVRRYNDLLATIVFLQYHPLVNEDILEYAIPKTLAHRKDTSFDAINPIEVNLGMGTCLIVDHNTETKEKGGF